MEALKAQDNVRNWQRCDIAQLVNHFHEMREATGDFQQVRLKCVALKGEALGILKSGIISDMTLHMALKKEQSVNGAISFEPVLEVAKSDNSVAFASFSPFDNDLPLTELVPYAFKEAVTRNWLLTDANGVDDLFVAYKPKAEKGSIPELQRLLRYYISGKTNSLLFNVLNMEEVRKEMKGVHLHLGADMNKAYDRSEFTFTPVVELRTGKLSEKTLLEIAKAGLRSSVGINASGDDSILFEYLRPCPSTCN